MMFAMGAFWMWAHDSRVVQDLKVIAAQPEVPALEFAIGFEAKSHRLQSAIVVSLKASASCWPTYRLPTCAPSSWEPMKTGFTCCVKTDHP